MIESEAKLRAALEALATLYSGLEALRREYGDRPRQLRLMAEGPLDEIVRLEAELQAYTQLFSPTPVVPVWLTLAGGLVRWSETPSRILAGALDSLRRGVQSLAQFDLMGRTDSRPTRHLLEASDPDVVLFQPGSLRVGLRWRHSRQANFLETEASASEAAVERAIQTAIRAVRELDIRGPSALANEDPVRRRLIFRVVARLAPTSREGFDVLSLSGPEVGEASPVVLSARTNELARAAIRELTTQAETRYEGEIREIDLDRRTFYLRSIELVGELHCKAGPTLDFARVRDALETRVLAFGVIDAGAPRRVFEVNDLEPVDE